MNIPYTICFIRRKTLDNDKILMLYRNKAPNIHKWNGVGGKIESGETPTESCLREIAEETSLKVDHVKYRGIVSWNGSGGMHVFTGENDEGELIECDEGLLEWKDLEWIKESDKVVSNIAYFLDEILLDEEPIEHAFVYDAEGDITSYLRKKLIINV